MVVFKKQTDIWSKFECQRWSRCDWIWGHSAVRSSCLVCIKLIHQLLHKIFGCGFFGTYSQNYTLKTENFVDKPKTSFFTVVNTFFFQKKSAFISLSATFFYWWKTVLFFEISRKRALHHTVIILAFFHFLIYARAWLGQKTFSANLASWKNPFTLWIQLLHGRNHQKNEKFEMTTFLTVSKARGLWGAEIASKSVITELTLSGHLRAESFNQIFGKK